MLKGSPNFGEPFLFKDFFHLFLFTQKIFLLLIFNESIFFENFKIKSA